MDETCHSLPFTSHLPTATAQRGILTRVMSHTTDALLLNLKWTIWFPRYLTWNCQFHLLQYRICPLNGCDWPQSLQPSCMVGTYPLPNHFSHHLNLCHHYVSSFTFLLNIGMTSCIGVNTQKTVIWPAFNADSLWTNAWQLLLLLYVCWQAQVVAVITRLQYDIIICILVMNVMIR